MSRACDRCGKPILKYGIQFKIKSTFKQFINNIDLVIQRRYEGIKNPEYEEMWLKGEIELCEKCKEDFGKFLVEGQIK